MSEYTTLVFRTDTPKGLEAAREAADSVYCRAWSMDHELLRLELIEQALDENDIDQAKSYIGEVDVARYIDRLKQ